MQNKEGTAQIRQETLLAGGKEWYPNRAAYGYNYMNIGSSRTVIGTDQGTSAKLSQIRNFSGCYVAMDTYHFSENTGYYDLWHNDATTTQYLADARRHNGILNVLYADWHSAGIKANPANPYYQLGNNGVSSKIYSAWTGGRFGTENN